MAAGAQDSLGVSVPACIVGGMNSAAHYDRLLADLGLSIAATFTAICTADEDDVIRCFGGDPAQARPGTLSDTTDGWDGEKQRIAVSRSGTAAVVVESNQFHGSREEVLRPLSRLGRAASAFWNVNANSQLSLAEDGLVQSAFDLYRPDQPHGAAPHAWRPYLDELGFGPERTWGAGLAALERATAARLDASWAAGPHLVVEIEPVPQAVLPQGLEDSPLLAQAPFDRYLARLGPHLLPEMQQYAMTLAVTQAGLAEDPLAVAALSAGVDGPADGCDRLWADLEAAHQAALARSHELRARESQAGTEADDGPVWERPSQVAFQQAIVFWALADYVVGDGDQFGRLGTAVVGDADRRARFLLLHRLHDAARRG